LLKTLFDSLIIHATQHRVNSQF